MNDQAADLDANEEILTSTMSDEALEAAADTESQIPFSAPSWYNMTQDCC
jgi:hypothetical protein